MKLETCLSNALLFAGTTAKERVGLLRCLMLDCCTYKKNETIVNAGDTQIALAVLARGTAHAFLPSWDGSQKLWGVLMPGDCVGLDAAFPGAPDSVAWLLSVRAARACQVVYLDIESLFSPCAEHCAAHERLRENLSQVTAQTLQAAARRIALLTVKSMRGRMVGYFLDRLREEGDAQTLSLPFNRNQMAAYLDVSRPSMSRELARMKQEGILDYYLDTIQILDREKLCALSDLRDEA